jgi:pseudouridine synthase
MRQGRNQVTIGRALSKLGVASRSMAKHLIADGRISLNGIIVDSADRWMDLRTDELSLDGLLLRAKERAYFVMNKPCGVVTTRSDEGGKRTVYDILPRHLPWVFPIGRLDKETSGLLLFTNDTVFGEFITSPTTKVPKTYVVELDRPLAHCDRERMERGLRLNDGTILRSAIVKPVKGGPDFFSITIVEGRNRQIRKMCEQLGYEVGSLKRISIGPVNLGGLVEGSIRSLTPSERLKFRQMTGRSQLYARHRVSNR